jgi:hypothetical protein
MKWRSYVRSSKTEEGLDEINTTEAVDLLGLFIPDNYRGIVRV